VLQGILVETSFADALIARETDQGLVLTDWHLCREVMTDAIVPILDSSSDLVNALLDSLAQEVVPWKPDIQQVETIHPTDEPIVATLHPTPPNSGAADRQVGELLAPYVLAVSVHVEDQQLCMMARGVSQQESLW
jgi:hypothetical protein